MNSLKICILTLSFWASFISAIASANQNYYCGKGKNSFIVEKAEYALVIDEEMTIYLRGIKQENFTITSIDQGVYQAVKTKDPENDNLVITFSSCRDSKAILKMTSNFTWNGKVNCTCEQL